MLKKLGLISLCAASAFAMHSVEININDKDLELAAKLDMGQFYNTIEPGTVFLGATFLKADAAHSDYNSDADIESYQELNFLMKRNIAENGFSIGLGVKVNHTENFTSIPLGVEAGLTLPTGGSIPVSVGASIYYAPEVLAMQDAKDFLEYRVHVDVEVIQNGMITVGYRNIDLQYDVANSETVNYNSSGYIGFKFAF
jgi:hypothetical protein